MAKMHGLEKKPRWLEEREREGRGTTHSAFHKRLQPQNLEGMVSLGSSYSQPQQPCEGVYASSTATATAAGSRGAPPITHNPGHSGFRLPKWALVGTAAVLALTYGVTWAAGIAPPQRSQTQQQQQYTNNNGNSGLTVLTPQPTQAATATPAISTARFPTVSSSLIRLRSFSDMPELASIADTIETTLGQDGYTYTEAGMISKIVQISEMAGLRKLWTVTDDLKTILVNKTYQNLTINLGDRNLDVIVLASDPARAPFYFDAVRRILPKVEAFTGLKYTEPLLFIYSQPNNDFGTSHGGYGTINTYYPEFDKTILRNYETTTAVKAFEEIAAHEFDHLITNTNNLPVVWSEGKANFTAYHALRSNDGLPAMEPPFEGYRANQESAIRNIFGGGIPPIIEHDGDYDSYYGLKKSTGIATALGDLFLQDMLKIVGSENMLLIIRDINTQSNKQFVDQKTFYAITLSHTPQDLLPQVTEFLQKRYEGK